MTSRQPHHLLNPPVLFDQRTPDIAIVMDPNTADIVKTSYSDLSPVFSKKDPQTVYGIVSDAAKSNPQWTIYKEDSVGLVLHGYERFGIFQFTDDFTIRVLPASDGSAIIDTMAHPSILYGSVGIDVNK